MMMVMNLHIIRILVERQRNSYWKIIWKFFKVFFSWISCFSYFNIISTLSTHALYIHIYKMTWYGNIPPSSIFFFFFFCFWITTNFVLNSFYILIIAPDSIMEPNIDVTIKGFLRAGGQPEVVITSLTNSYRGIAQVLFTIFQFILEVWSN